jgi:hypothetical protein
VFTAPNYLGQFYILQDATIFLATEVDMVKFLGYEAVGIGIGNTRGITKVNFG